MHRLSIAVVAALVAALAVVSLSAAAHQSTHAKRPSPAPDRLALTDGDRGSVRNRSRQAGRRGRQPVELSEARAPDEPLGLRPERRGDCELPPRPRRHLVRPRQLRLAAPPARDQGRVRGGGDQPETGVPGDPGLGRLTGHNRGANAVVRSMRRHLAAIVASVPTTRRHLRVYHELDPTYYSATSQTFIGSVYKLFGFRDIADAAGGTGGGYPQLSGEYIIAKDPTDHRPRRHEVLRAVLRERVDAPGWGTIAAVEHHRVVRRTTTSPRAGGRGSCSSRARWRGSRSRAEWPRRPAEWRRHPASRRGASASAPASSPLRSSSRRSPSASPSGRCMSASARSSARRSRTSRSSTSSSRSERSTTP